MPTGVAASLLDLAIMEGQTVKGETVAQTAQRLEVTPARVANTMRKPAIRELVMAELNRRGYTAEKFADKLIELVEAERAIVIANEIVNVPDNTTRDKAHDRWGKILGVEAPKQLDLRHSLAGASDAELVDELETALGGQELVSQPGQPATGEGNTDPL